MEQIKNRRRRNKEKAGDGSPPPRHLPMRLPVPEVENEPQSMDDNLDGIDKHQVGMICDTKSLYRRENHREAWQEWSPEDIARLISKSSSNADKFALIVRREKQDSDNGDPILALHSIEVQSPLIKARLHHVFKDNKNIATGLKRLTFTAPFREFYYQWTEFVQQKSLAKEDQDDDYEEAQKHYDLLFQIIHAELDPHFQRAADMLENGVITFDYLWMIFEPGTEVYANIDGHHRIFLLISGEYKEVSGKTLYNLSCRYIDTDGDSFGYVSVTLSIEQFHGIVRILELNTLPSHLHPDIETIRPVLQGRGRKFERLRGCHCKTYSGQYVQENPPSDGFRRRYIESGRVMVDGNAFGVHTGQGMYRLGSLTQSLVSEPVEELNDDEIEMYLPRAIQTLHRKARESKRRLARATRSRDKLPLSEDQYALCGPTVRGYCFKIKGWVHLLVDGLGEITWNKRAFERLVLPNDYKSIVWAFVNAQMAQDDSFDDIIQGKGRGMIMLLSGEPGTGKTLTSESVAEAMQKPLYSLSAGELGLAADAVEQNLSRVLELCKKWRAVLLIDECDVFLESRSTADLHRNQLVSVFLRLLEYYEGVMFLTTNRIDSFDPAFESRIDLTLHYPALDFESRRHIWRTFLRPDGYESEGITNEDIDKVAKEELNGREIKNTVKTARLLAAQDKTTMGLEHLEMVIRVKKGRPARLG